MIAGYVLAFGAICFILGGVIVGVAAYVIGRAHGSQRKT